MSATIPTAFSEMTSQRRSIRALTSASPVPNSTIISLAHTAIRDVPSAFNSQTTRLTILFGPDHAKLWSIVANTLKAHMGDTRFSQPAKPGMPTTKDRMAMFASAHGTILFWDETAVAKDLKDTSPEIYKDKTDEWVSQSNGMHQYYLWVALSSLGFGVNLQHYNPVIDAEVQKTWGVAGSWKLKAQMVFGVPKEGAREELPERVQKVKVEERVGVFGAGEE